MDVPTFNREDLRTGDHLSGPAMIIEAQTTSLVSPGYEAVIDRAGNIVMSRGKS